MSRPLRTIALLMLVAGLSMGVFAARALRALAPADDPVAWPGGPERIERTVDLLRRDFRLDERQADRVRQELLRYDRRVRDRLYELRQQHAADFRAYFEETEDGILTVLREAEAAR